MKIRLRRPFPRPFNSPDIPRHRFVNSLTGQAGPIKPLPLVTVALSIAKGGAPEGEPQAKVKKAA